MCTGHWNLKPTIFLAYCWTPVSKHSHSLLFGLIRRLTFQTAPFGLKISGCQLTTHPKNFQGGAFAYIDYFRTIREEMYRALARQTQYFCLHLWKLDKGENSTFYFTENFCCFRLNKSVTETTETKQAGSQLYFTPKIIEIYLLVFENESIEVAMLVPKTSQNWKLVFSLF